MIASNSNENSSSYSYVGGMLNVVYLTGFVRNPTENGFLLQQTNNINHAIPIEVRGKHRRFRDKEPVTVICHAYGNKPENGDRTMVLNAIKVEVPTLLTMPDEVVWNSKLPEGMTDEDFRPFGPRRAGADKTERNGLDKSIEAELSTTMADVVNEIFVETGANYDRTLGAAANNMRCAGFIEGFAMARDANGNPVDDCLTLLIRQHKDANLSLPVRLYGRYAKTYMEKLSIGRPIRVDGQVRVNAKAQEDGTIKTFTYLHTSQLRAADQEVSIRSRPEWLQEMKNRIVEDKTRRVAQAQARRAEAESDFDPEQF